MGANAVTTVPVYTAGEVLTAADLNITNSGIPVFASTVERDAAFGGAGEKTLAEGQFAYIEATNTTQYYDGAAWQPVGASGLTFITGASFSAVSSVSAPTSTFTSAYKQYKVIVNLTTVSAGTDITLRFRAAGLDITTSIYRQMTLGLIDTAATANTTGTRSNINLGTTENTLDFFTCSLEINDMAASAQCKAVQGFVTSANPAAGGLFGYFINGGTNTGAAYDSISIINSGANITGTYRIYGYSES